MGTAPRKPGCLPPGLPSFGDCVPGGQARAVGPRLPLAVPRTRGGVGRGFTCRLWGLRLVWRPEAAFGEPAPGSSGVTVGVGGGWRGSLGRTPVSFTCEGRRDLVDRGGRAMGGTDLLRWGPV